MQRRIDGFLLRRTSEINQRFLPDKTTFTVFCRPSLLQVCRRHESLLRMCILDTRNWSSQTADNLIFRAGVWWQMLPEGRGCHIPCADLHTTTS